MAINRFGSANPEDIKKFEQKYNVNLPQDYIDFLYNYNGGIIEKDDENQVFVKDLSTSIVIDVLFGLNTGNHNSNIDMWMDKLGDDMLENSVIIGDDIQHGLIILICRGEYEGVYYWDDSYNFSISNDDENTYFISNNFSIFTNSMI
jgi:hypothetical protein